MLTVNEARDFYDRFGSKQDRQAFYEDAALRYLVLHGAFEGARAVVEFGCGTGRFAEQLLRQVLPSTASYRGFDLSGTMVSLARTRLAEFGARAEVGRTDGSLRLPIGDGECDRFVSTYVVDLLPAETIYGLLDEAHRLLAVDGRLCLATLTPGYTLLSRAVGFIWKRLHAWRPETVGGCRPVDLIDFLRDGRWKVLHDSKTVAFGISSQTVVAVPK